MIYTLLADLVVVVHACYIGFILLGQLAIPIGAVLRWSWVRNPVFRLTHLLAIAIVAAESLAGVCCPLTIWEDQLRGLAGQAVSEGTFMGRLCHELLFYELPSWVFTVSYVAFTALVLLTLVLVPPRWSRLRGRSSGAPIAPTA